MLSKTKIYRIVACGVAILALSLLAASALSGRAIAEADGRAYMTIINAEPFYPNDARRSMLRVQVATPTSVGGYPPPLAETPAPPPDAADDTQQGYPIGGSEPTALSPGAYPPVTSINPFSSTSESLFSNTATAPINSTAQSTNQLQDEDANPSQQGSSSLLLWLGFMLALIVFVIGVVGSIILFARQRITGN